MKTNALENTVFLRRFIDWHKLTREILGVLETEDLAEVFTLAGVFSIAGTLSKPGPKPKGKGPKPKPVPVVKVKSSKLSKDALKRTSAGREAVKAGLRPPIKDAMAQVMGDEVLNADTIHDRLVAKGWLPDAKKPRAYVGYLLSATKERFESVPTRGRGFYRAKPWPKATPKSVPQGSVPKGQVKRNGFVDLGAAASTLASTKTRILTALGDHPRREASIAGLIKIPADRVRAVLGQLATEGLVRTHRQYGHRYWAKIAEEGSANVAKSTTVEDVLAELGMTDNLGASFG